MATGVQVSGGAIEYIHQQFDATGFDAVTDYVAEQAVAANVSFDAALCADLDSLRANRHAATDRPQQQAAGGIGVEQVVVADETGGKASAGAV